MRLSYECWQWLSLFYVSLIFPVEKCEELSTTKLNLEVGKETRDSLEVSWDVAPNSTSTDSRYLVCWAPTGWRHNERCANVTEHQETFTIHDLASCSWYNVSVSALDADGERLAFEIVQQFTDGENSQPPSMEQSLTIDIISNTMTVSHWSLVRNQTCVSSFTVCWKKTDGLNETCRESPAYDDITIKDLDFCTNYTITTYTSSIDGLDSANRTLYRSTGSGNVENVTLSSGPDSITVKWDPPTQGRECFSHFSIFHKNINDQEGEVEVKADVNEYVFTELEGCTQWYFVIRVISDEHVFSRSEGHLISTTANAPSPVEDLKVGEVKSHSLHLTWSPPSENNRCLFKYKVCWRKRLEGAAKCETRKLEVYPRHSVYGLESCTDYTVTVSTMGSQTRVGNETSLAVSTGPEPVTALKVDNVDTRSVTVSWESPSCAQQFSVCWGAWQDKGGHSCTSVTNTSYTVSGLEPGNNYTIMVAALGVNEAQSDIRVVTSSVAQGPPKVLVAKNSTRDSVTVGWSVSLDLPTPDLARVCWKLADSSSDVTCSETTFSGQKYTISDLEPCRWYKVTIFTPFGENMEEYGSVELFTDDINNEQPKGVNNLSTRQFHGALFNVEWDKSTDSCASHFLVCLEKSPAKDNGCKLIPSYETYFFKGDLNVCTNVTVSVSAVSVNGLSSGNESITITTAPGRVQNLTSWLVELGSVGLKWDPPLPGEDCVDHYIVEARDNEYIVNATGDNLQYILSNLTLCQHHIFSIISIGSEGALSKPASLHTTSGAWAPGEVTEPEVTQTGSHSLHLEWKRPLELFDCLVMYSVCWKETNKTDSACAEQKLKPYPKRTLYGLKSCTEYTVTLAALGVGRLHDNDTTLTQSTGPEPVTALKVDNVDTRSVTVSWESPSCTQQFSVCWGAWQDKGAHSCTSVTNTSYTVSGLEPGNNYTIMVTALGVNEAQSDVRVVTASVAQEKVNKLTVKNYTRNSITVFWGAPFNQKSSRNASVCWNVIGEYSDETCSNSTISDEEYTIDDLEPCHWYKVTVALENGQGKKFESVEQFMAASNTEPPEEVKELSTRRIYYDSFRIEWDKSNDSCASHFLVCWEQSGNHENGCELEPSYKTSFYKDDLNVCTNVTVSVSAVSVDGLSSGNESITITTGPGVVRNVTSWIVELGSVGVRWEPPSPGEDCVSYYAVSTWGSYPQTQANVTGDKLEYVWTNLTHCEHKMFMIRAVNSQHAVSNSALKFSTSGTGAPGEVTEPEVTQTGSHSLHVEWKPPLELFDCLLRYSVCWKETNGTDGACAEQKLEEYPKRTLYGLKSCTEYTVTLASLGAGRMHDNDTTLTQFTGPEPVTALKVDNVDTRSVTVSWESPSCAQQFSVCWGAWQDKGGHSCTSVTNTSYTVSGLEPGNNYTIMVAALGVNEAQSDLNIITVQLPPGA